jgi:prepilin-type N-terminal cleavage/methylation domain-containing protein
MKRAGKTHINQQGFTMIEIVVVLIILAILTATVTSSYTSVNTDVPNEREILKSSLRFAQTKALNNAIDNNTWGISFTSGGSSYALVYIASGITTSPINLPGECGTDRFTCIPSATHNLPADMTITGSAVNFDKWGSPGANDVDIVLKEGGSAVVTVKVTKNTGYILIQ